MLYVRQKLSSFSSSWALDEQTQNSKIVLFTAIYVIQYFDLNYLVMSFFCTNTFCSVKVSDTVVLKHSAMFFNYCSCQATPVIAVKTLFDCCQNTPKHSWLLSKHYWLLSKHSCLLSRHSWLLSKHSWLLSRHSWFLSRHSQFALSKNYREEF